MSKLITMTDKELLHFETIQKLVDKRITRKEAEVRLDLTGRHIRRLKKKVEAQGAQGFAHASRGKTSNRKLPDNTRSSVVTIITEKYSDFGPTLAQEKLAELHDIHISDETVRAIMIHEKLWKSKPQGDTKNHHLWRPRKDMYGEMQQFDGSYHMWFEDRGEEMCLLASIDDATGDITGLEFAPNEGVEAVFNFWKHYVLTHGRPKAIYLDKYSTYKINHKNAVDNSDLITQFQRASKQLDIHLIHAHSPQAKGRIERLFQTLQDRLVKELRLRNISNIAEANTYLKDEFIGWFNAQFGVVAASKGDAHQSLTDILTEDLESIFSIHSKRKVNNDYTIRFKNKWLQLTTDQQVTVCKKDVVVIEERSDYSLHILHATRQKYLNYVVLPERPIRKKQVVALVAKSKTHKPSDNHPWRKRFLPEKVARA